MEHFCPSGECSPILRILNQCVIDTIYQVLVAKRLLDELQGPLFHRLNRHRNVTVTRDKYHRQHRTDGVEVLLNLQSAHFRHAYVEHQASGSIWVKILQELTGPGIYRGLEAHSV